MTEQIKKILWMTYYYLIYGYKCMETNGVEGKMRLMDSETTARCLLGWKCSVSRYGNGELQMVGHFLTQGCSKNFEEDISDLKFHLAGIQKGIYESNLADHTVCHARAFNKAEGGGCYDILPKNRLR